MTKAKAVMAENKQKEIYLQFFYTFISASYNAKDDGISAKYNDGILKITIPKSKQEVRASKNINIE